mmetsp:Transcript_238/g.297  ORF Transcript_238/g.297 Transcript_238/m.297 type:complete len:218 (-) Transcript_238:2355-3008(-)
MQLTECLDIAIELNRFDDEVKECLSGYLFKTTTVFHGNEDLNLDPLFGALCFSYSLGGFAMLVLKPKWSHKASFPFVAYALLLLLVQGPLSFWADYLSMTNDSYVHVIDRFMAIVLFITTFWRIASIAYFQRPSVCYAEFISILFAAFCFMNSQDAQVNEDVNGWIFWHTMWHLYPFIPIAIQCTDRFLLVEYNYLPMKITERPFTKAKYSFRLKRG